MLLWWLFWSFNLWNKFIRLYVQLTSHSFSSPAAALIHYFDSLLRSDIFCEKTVFLSDKKGLIVFQNLLLSKTFFISKDSLYFILSLLYYLLQKVLCFLCSLMLVWVLILRHFLSSWVLRIIAFLKVFVMYGAWLPLGNFFLNGAWFHI